MFYRRFAAMAIVAVGCSSAIDEDDDVDTTDDELSVKECEAEAQAAHKKCLEAARGSSGGSGAEAACAKTLADAKKKCSALAPGRLGVSRPGAAPPKADGGVVTSRADAAAPRPEPPRDGGTATQPRPEPPRDAGTATQPRPEPPRDAGTATKPPEPPRDGGTATHPPEPPRDGGTATHPPQEPPRDGGTATKPPEPPRDGGTATQPPPVTPYDAGSASR